MEFSITNAQEFQFALESGKHGDTLIYIEDDVESTYRLEQVWGYEHLAVMLTKETRDRNFSAWLNGLPDSIEE